MQFVADSGDSSFCRRARPQSIGDSRAANSDFRVFKQMRFGRWFRRTTLSPHLTAQAAELARRCYGSVDTQLAPALEGMSFAEARGYVRARSAAVLDLELSRFREQSRCCAEVANVLRDRAIDELIRLAIGDLMRGRRQSMRLRGAA